MAAKGSNFRDLLQSTCEIEKCGKDQDLCPIIKKARDKAGSYTTAQI